MTLIITQRYKFLYDSLVNEKMNIFLQLFRRYFKITLIFLLNVYFVTTHWISKPVDKANHIAQLNRFSRLHVFGYCTVGFITTTTYQRVCILGNRFVIAVENGQRCQMVQKCENGRDRIIMSEAHARAGLPLSL